MNYTVVIEQADHNYSAFVPDLPGCVATGRSVDEVTANIREAIRWHIEALREDDMPVPEPKTVSILVGV